MLKCFFTGEKRRKFRGVLQKKRVRSDMMEIGGKCGIMG